MIDTLKTLLQHDPTSKQNWHAAVDIVMREHGCTHDEAMRLLRVIHSEMRVTTCSPDALEAMP